MELGPASAGVKPHMPDGGADFGAFDRWQHKALECWEAANHIGVIEAVTGTGKTHVAFKAIRQLRQQLGEGSVYPLIVVPTVALMEQWRRGLEEHVGGPVAMYGNGKQQTFGTPIDGQPPTCVVATIHSAVKALDQGLLAHCNGLQRRSLLVADECHHLQNPNCKLFSQVVKHPFHYKLGLTATASAWECPVLGEIVYEFNLRSALKEGVIPPFDIVNVAIELDDVERQAYLDYSKDLRNCMRKLHEEHDLGDMPSHFFWAYIDGLVKQEDPIALGIYKAVFRRASIVYEAAEKMQLAATLVRELVGELGRKALVFFERTDSADDVALECGDGARAMAEQLKGKLGGPGGVRCHVYHSGLLQSARQQTLETFRHDGASALLSCRALNEGLDVPAVDVALIVASTQSERAMIQRIGRTLRRGDGTKRPIVIVLWAKGTRDEGVRINPDDGYYANTVPIYDCVGKEAVPLVRRLARGLPAEPAAAWETIATFADGEDAILCAAGELANEDQPVRLVLLGEEIIKGKVAAVIGNKRHIIMTPGKRRVRAHDVARLERGASPAAPIQTGY